MTVDRTISLRGGRRRIMSFAITWTLLVMPLVSCRANGNHRKVAQSGPPNVLMIVWDTVRADRLGLYGYTDDTTPGVDAFFSRKGRIYDRAISPAPWTLPSHGAIFTGLFPTTTGATHDHKWLDDRFETLAEHLHREGFATYLNSANPNVSRETNLTQGFELQAHPWQDETHQGDAQSRHEGAGRIARRLDRKDSSESIVRAFLGWLDGRPDTRPYFAYINFMEAHWPRRLSKTDAAELSPEDQDVYSRIVSNRQPKRMAFNFECLEYSPEELAMMNHVYDDAVRRLDRSTARLLRQLKKRQQLRNTMIIFTSDHGENLGDHHLLGHEFSVHETLLRVPLAIRYPSRFPPGRTDLPVQTSDLFRTILDTVGIDAAPKNGEESYSLVDAEQQVPSRRALVSEYLAPKRRVLDQLLQEGCSEPEFEVLRALEFDGTKTIWSDLGRRELFRPVTDPGEIDDFSKSDPEALQSLISLMDHWISARPKSDSVDQPAQIDEEARERLKALGYL